MSEIKTEEISELLKKQITDFEKKVDVSEIGTVTYIGDGVAKVYGLTTVWLWRCLSSRTVFSEWR